jgi:hypothetical protein
MQLCFINWRTILMCARLSDCAWSLTNVIISKNYNVDWSGIDMLIMLNDLLSVSVKICLRKPLMVVDIFILTVELKAFCLVFFKASA